MLSDEEDEDIEGVDVDVGVSVDMKVSGAMVAVELLENDVPDEDEDDTVWTAAPSNVRAAVSGIEVGIPIDSGRSGASISQGRVPCTRRTHL